MSETSLTEFSLGAVYGKRAFNVSKDGHLTGVTYEMRWKPGENHSVCVNEYGLSYWALTPWTREVFLASRQAEGKADLEHRSGRLECTCGFYAYYDNKDNSFAVGPSKVEGIIRGYGITSIGTRGFRCEKAEIVALVKPSAMTRSWMSSPLLALWMLMSGAMQAMFSTRDFLTQNWWGGIISGILAVIFIAWGLFDPILAPNHKKWRKIRKNYPDIPLFPSMKKAQKAFPLTNHSDYALENRKYT